MELWAIFTVPRFSDSSEFVYLNSKLTAFSSSIKLISKNRNSSESKELVDGTVKDLVINLKQFKFLTKEITDKENVSHKHLCWLENVILKMSASVLPIVLY